jgi:hypothetical protein
MKASQNTSRATEEKEDSQADHEDSSQFQEHQKPIDGKLAHSQFFNYDYEELRRRTLQSMTKEGPLAESYKKFKESDQGENNFHGSNGKPNGVHQDYEEILKNGEMNLKEESVSKKVEEN